MVVSRLHHLERMRALVGEATARARQQAADSLRAIHLIVYGSLPDSTIHELFEIVSANTPAQGAALRIERVGSRYICWNCCGIRFESGSGVCPNCGELGMEVPEEIEFGLKRIEAA